MNFIKIKALGTFIDVSLNSLNLDSLKTVCVVQEFPVYDYCIILFL